MQAEVYAATNMGSQVNVSATAKAAIPSGVQTKETLAQAQKDLIALVAQGKVKFRDNAHLFIGQPNPQTVVPVAGLAAPQALHNFDSVQLFAIKVS